MVKPLKNCFFGLNLPKKGVIMSHAQNKKQFFGRNTKSRSSAFRNFLFCQNIISLGWVMNLCLSWVMYFVKKKCHFQLKQLWEYKNSGLVVILHCLNSFQHNYVAFSLLYVQLRENHKINAVCFPSFHNGCNPTSKVWCRLQMGEYTI